MSQVIPSKAEFDIVYDGPALELNEMEVKELAPALLALSDLIEETNKIINGDKIKVLINVKGSFKRGSFLTQISVHQNFINQLLDFFASNPIEGALNLLMVLGLILKTGQKTFNGLLQVIKWLRKRKITNIISLENGNVKIIVDDDSLETVPDVIKLLENYKIRQSVEKAINRPLQKEGVDLFAVKTSETEILVVNKEESQFFECPPLQEEEIDDQTYITNLQIVTLAFQDGNKWKVTDGNAPFYATVEDTIFLNKINNNEVSFSKGDILKAKIRKRVWLDVDSTMKAEYIILEVISHESAAKQLKLL